MKTKRWLWPLLIAALGMVWAPRAQAVFVSSDSLTITIQPNAFYQLDMDTATASLNLGIVDLDASTYTVRPATVTIGSTFATTDVRIFAGIVGGWTLDIDSTTRETDALQAWAVFTDTSLASRPTSPGAFSGTSSGTTNSDMLGTVPAYAGLAGGKTQYVLLPGEPGYKTMDAIPSFASDPAASAALLWLRFILPQVTTFGNAQQVQVTVGAAAPVP